MLGHIAHLGIASRGCTCLVWCGYSSHKLLLHSVLLTAGRKCLVRLLHMLLLGLVLVDGRQSSIRRGYLQRVRGRTHLVQCDEARSEMIGGQVAGSL